MKTSRALQHRPGVDPDDQSSEDAPERALPTPPTRPVIGRIRPQVDGGRRPAKSTIGDVLVVEADGFADGHDVLRCELRYRHESESKWSTTSMTEIGNDRWRGRLPITKLGRYRFCVRAWADPYATWSRDLRARAEGGQVLDNELETGADVVDEVARRAKNPGRRMLSSVADQFRSGVRGLETDLPEEIAAWVAGETLSDLIFSDQLLALVGGLVNPDTCTTSETLSVVADPAKARFSAWYEMFPRSASSDPARHGTFADVRVRLSYIERMGFDVLYLPPIHPIGRTGRKGQDGTTLPGRDDPGSPWAIGAADGGHRSIHCELGTLNEFRQLITDAATRGIDVAIDLAFQTSPDHPWVIEHPEWFRHRPDGSIRHAENPPKKYEDIYPLEFDTPKWQGLWNELLEVVRYWISQGISVFRVDNPHTKPFAFWEWLLTQVKAEHPDVIFLSEAFTRPRVMEHLAKIGFTQSYTYFTWRHTKWELQTYLEELTRTDIADYFRPNFWPATPDILTEELQIGGRAAFLSRFVLAATLSASYGIYGPAFELQEHLPRATGSEEYRRSEKYEIRSWDLENPESLSGFIGVVNQARREHPALQFNDALCFHEVDNEQLIAYSKTRWGSEGNDVILTVVNLDHTYAQAGWIGLDFTALEIDPNRPYVMHDLLTDAHYVWEGPRNFVKLDPVDVPCHLFSVTQPAVLTNSELAT